MADVGTPLGGQAFAIHVGGRVIIGDTASFGCRPNALQF